ncbi:hypothetical protein KCP74_10640 [Salmonella enterica subsp. enterica]|nr:hypothetical protein KCP74_10640 [Salmonella enterica subsp. enterica]
MISDNYRGLSRQGAGNTFAESSSTSCPGVYPLQRGTPFRAFWTEIRAISPAREHIPSISITFAA